MTERLRLGAVSYLNVRPLVDGLDARSDVSIRFDVPSACARLLAEGAIDLGMVPSITYADRPGDRIVPGLCIGSEGAVASVALFTRRPLAEVRSIALDTSSRTSAALVRILCRRRFAIAPTFVPHRPDLSSMLADADAALLIGDPALFLDPSAHGAEKVDLGAAWTDMTGLPFVWAFWSGPEHGAGAGAAPLLHEVARQGIARTDAIAAAYCACAPEWTSTAQAYLRQHLTYALDDRSLEGLRTYYREAASLGLIATAPEPRFFYN